MNDNGIQFDSTKKSAEKFSRFKGIFNINLDEIYISKILKIILNIVFWVNLYRCKANYTAFNWTKPNFLQLECK